LDNHEKEKLCWQKAPVVRNEVRSVLLLSLFLEREWLL